MAKRRDKRLRLINACNNYKNITEFSTGEDSDRQALVRAISQLKTQDENVKKINVYNKKISSDIVDFLMQEDLDLKLMDINEGDESEGEEEKNRIRFSSLKKEESDSILNNSSRKLKPVKRNTMFLTPARKSTMKQPPRPSFTQKNM